MQRILLLTVFALFSSTLLAQKKHTISGYVKSATDGEALIGARVYVTSAQTGVAANIYGFYSLTLPEGEYEVLYSYIGFKAQKKGVSLTEDITLNIELYEDVEKLEEFVVTDEVKQHESTEIGTMELSMEKVKTLPVLLGEVDIIKTAQLLPGIQSGSEGSSGFYVRGGGPDQNLILLDGVPIYNANHLFGFFSVFNADAINSVKITKGGFPARYGGRLSSVLDIRMNEGDSKKLHGEGAVGIISSKLMLNGPIIKDKTSFMISARRTYVDVLARPFIAMANKNSDDKVSGGYYFYDINSKLNHKINEKNRVYFSAYLGNDRFYIDQSYSYTDQNSISQSETTSGQIKWGNKIMALRWNHQFGPKLFMNATANYSSYNFLTGFSSKINETSNTGNVSEDYTFQYLSGINDWGGKLDFYYYPTNKHKVRFGGGETYHTFRPGVNNFKLNGGGTSIDTTFGSRNTYAHELYAFVEDDLTITKRLAANVGLHTSSLLVRNKWYHSLQPRVAVNYKLDESSSIKASYSRMTQFLHLLSNTSIGLPTDLWVPATDSIPPQYGNQFSAGYFRELPKGYRVSGEAYYKTMKNLIEYKDGAGFFGANTDWEQLVEVGKGWSYGAEVLFEKRTGKTTGWIGYTLAWTNRQFDNLNNGEIFPYRYDRRHDVSVAVTHKFNDRIDMGVVWVYGTGNAVSLPLQKYNSLIDPSNGYYPTQVEHIENRNDYRMPAYHRLDIGVNIHKEKKWGEATWALGLYNAYSRRNPFYLTFGYLKNSNKYVLKQISLFPIIPSVSYSFKF